MPGVPGGLGHLSRLSGRWDQAVWSPQSLRSLPARGQLATSAQPRKSLPLFLPGPWFPPHGTCPDFLPLAPLPGPAPDSGAVGWPWAGLSEDSGGERSQPPSRAAD